MQSTYLNFVTDLIIDCFCKDFFFPHQKKSYFYLCGKHSKTNPCWEKKDPLTSEQVLKVSEMEAQLQLQGQGEGGPAHDSGGCT